MSRTGVEVRPGQVLCGDQYVDDAHILLSLWHFLTPLGPLVTTWLTTLAQASGQSISQPQANQHLNLPKANVLLSLPSPAPSIAGIH